MALVPEVLTEIDEVLSSSDADARVFVQLRSRFPQLSWTRCDAADLTESPFRSYPRFEIHLVDRSDHCVRITADPSCASGIVLAARNVAP